MRKACLILLAVLLAAGVLPALGEEGFVTVYQSNFSAGTDGWYGRGGAVLSRGLNWLRVEGRTADVHSPGRDFVLPEGYPCRVSVQVRQAEADSAEMMISAALTLDGKEKSGNLVRASVKKNAWTTLSAEFTPGHCDKCVLYLETAGAPEMAFEFRSFRLQTSALAPTAVPTEAPAGTEAADGIPSLKEVYAGSFDFGAALPQSALRNVEVMKLFRTQFGILTPENELKPDSVLDVSASRKLTAEGDETAVAVRFDAAKRLLDFAQANGIKVHGHVLVWHSQTPEAFFHEGYDTQRPLVSREVMLGRMENYIRQVLGYMEETYPGLIVSWDVVNEAIDDGTGRLRDSNWTKTVGEDFVLRAFEYARKYAPEGTKLYYNDYNTAMAGKRSGIIRLLKELMAEGNIDGYGFQMHHSLSFPSMAQITASVEQVAALGLRLRVSELDIGMEDRSEKSLDQQAKMYAQIMKLLLRFSDQVEAVQVWGVSDNMSWRAKNYPLLFDAGLQPKPAFYAAADPASVR